MPLCVVVLYCRQGRAYTSYFTASIHLCACLPYSKEREDTSHGGTYLLPAWHLGAACLSLLACQKAASPNFYPFLVSFPLSFIFFPLPPPQWRACGWAFLRLASGRWQGREGTPGKGLRHGRSGCIQGQKEVKRNRGRQQPVKLPLVPIFRKRTPYLPARGDVSLSLSLSLQDSLSLHCKHLALKEERLRRAVQGWKGGACQTIFPGRDGWAGTVCDPTPPTCRPVCMYFCLCAFYYDLACPHDPPFWYQIVSFPHTHCKESS